MNDPWKYVAFPAAGMAGYLVSIGMTGQVETMLGLSTFLSRLVVIGGTALVAGFMVDEVIPAYIEKVRSGGGGDLDMGGGGDDDFDFD
jgi:hypothetical protein